MMLGLMHDGKGGDSYRPPLVVIFSVSQTRRRLSTVTDDSSSTREGTTT